MTASLQVAVAVGDQIERFGSYFGYAAIVGLAVLSLLYFAQAREVRRLREWAGRAPERDAELAQRVQADAQRRVIAQPIAAPSPAIAPAGPQTPAAQQAEAARKAAATAAPAKAQGAGVATPSPGVGPPGTLARTMPAGAAGGLAPAASPGAVQPPPGGVAAAAATTSASSPADAPPSGAASPDASAAATSDAPASAGSAPATTADSPGAAPGAAAPGSASPPAGSSAPGSPSAPSPGGSALAPDAVPPGMSPATAGAVAAARRAQAPSRTTGPVYANGAGQDTHESDAARPAPFPDLPPRPPRTVANAPTDDGGPRSRAGAIIAGVVTLLVIAVVLVVVLASGGSDPKPAGNEIGDATPPPAAAPPPSAPGTPAKVNRANTQVAVLNGTTTTGLARGVADKLEKSGFTILSVGDNADQAIATTTIAYSGANERAARTVAQIMDVSSSAVKPIDTNTSVAVAPEAKVVVIVGNDRSTTG